MKTIIRTIVLMAVLSTQSFAQHIPPCQGNAHSTSICWGYATGRAFSRSWNDSRCPLSTLYLQNINSTYFEWHGGSSLSGMQSGDIVAFNGHTAFVVSVGDPIDSTRVDQVPNEGGPEQINVRLSTVKQNYENPTGYWRKKTIWSITVQNSFTGGKVGVNGQEYNSPYTASNLYWGATVSIDAVMDGRSHEGYVRRFQRWLKDGGEFNTSKTVNVTIIDYTFSQTYTADFKKEFNITFQNGFIGVGNAGIMEVDDEQYALPRSAFPVMQDQSITAEAISGQAYNSIIYTLTQWSDGSTSYSRSFTPNDHATYTANFTGKPLAVTITSSSGPVGTNVKIIWQEHPNTNVTQYQIWRKVKHNGVWNGPNLLTTLNRGTTSFTDPDYLFTEDYTHDLLLYDIRAYYSTEGAYADPNWIATYGQLYRVPAESATQRSRPTEYAISNYPNPFNPVTNIAFELVEEAHVTLAIYNVKGQRAIQLVDEDLKDGYYRLLWDGKDQSGQTQTSGYYFARLVISPARGGQTQVLLQRMLLLK